jgi:hypothetical protein
MKKQRHLRLASRLGFAKRPEGAVGDVEEGCREAHIQTKLNQYSANVQDTVRCIEFVLDGDGPKVASEVKGPGARNKN